MTWSVCGIKAVKPSNMNINTAGVGKRYAPYTQEKSVWDLWLF